MNQTAKQPSTLTSIDCTKATEEQLIKAWNNKNVSITGIHTIGTHPSPHVDEMAAFVALQETPQGKKRFPGIEKAVPAVITQTKLAAMEALGFKGFIRALRSGCLLVGVGNGPFDEHSNRAQNISCLELVTKFLDLGADKRNRIAFWPIKEFINHEDNNSDNLLKAAHSANIQAVQKAKNAAGQKLSDEDGKLPKEVSDVLLMMQKGMIPGTLKKAFETIDQSNPNEFLNVFNTGYNMIKFEYKQSLLFQDACDEYALMKESIKANAVPLTKDGEYRMLIVESDNPLMAKAVFNRNPQSGPHKVGVLLIAKKTGTADPENPQFIGRQFAIIPHEKFKGNMQDVVQMIQQKVHRAQHGSTLPFFQLGKFGAHSDVPQLYFDENQKIIMNGSKTDFDVPGLLDVELHIEDIVTMVTTAVFKQFEKRNAAKCNRGICPKVSEGASCSLFSSNLSFCKEVHANTKKTTTK